MRCTIERRRRIVAVCVHGSPLVRCFSVFAMTNRAVRLVKKCTPRDLCVGIPTSGHSVATARIFAATRDGYHGQRTHPPQSTHKTVPCVVIVKRAALVADRPDGLRCCTPQSGEVGWNSLSSPAQFAACMLPLMFFFHCRPLDLKIKGSMDSTISYRPQLWEIYIKRNAWRS